MSAIFCLIHSGCQWKALPRSLGGRVVDGKEYVPLGITIDAANRHDMKMTRTTLQSIVVHGPKTSTKLK